MHITEKALSIDSLFVFVVSPAPPPALPGRTGRRIVARRRRHQPGFCAVFILLAGAALIEKLPLGLLPVRCVAAVDGDQPGRKAPAMTTARGTARQINLMRWVSKVVPASATAHRLAYALPSADAHLHHAVLLCVIAIGTADVMFAIDSIPTDLLADLEPYHQCLLPARSRCLACAS